MGPAAGESNGLYAAGDEGPGATINFLLEPFMRIHLYSEYSGFEPGTSIVYIYILSGVALLILVIAGSTYINLSTARSVDRAREVGVRKVIGAGKGQLFWQFIGESLSSLYDRGSAELGYRIAGAAGLQPAGGPAAAMDGALFAALPFAGVPGGE